MRSSSTLLYHGPRGFSWKFLRKTSRPRVTLLLQENVMGLVRWFNFWACGWNPMAWPFKRNLLRSASGTICFVCSSKFWICGQNPMVWPFKWNLFGGISTWYGLFLGVLQKKKKNGPLLEVSGLRLRQLTVVVIVVLFRVRWMFLSVTLQHFRKLTCPRVWDLRSVLMLHSLCSMLCRLT